MIPSKEQIFFVTVEQLYKPACSKKQDFCDAMISGFASKIPSLL